MATIEPSRAERFLSIAYGVEPVLRSEQPKNLVYTVGPHVLAIHRSKGTHDPVRVFMLGRLRRPHSPLAHRGDLVKTELWLAGRLFNKSAERIAKQLPELQEEFDGAAKHFANWKVASRRRPVLRAAAKAIDAGETFDR